MSCDRDDRSQLSHYQKIANEIERLSALGYPAETPESRDQLFNLPSFLDAIANTELSFEVRKHEPKTLRDALNKAVRLEMLMKDRQEKEAVKPRGAVRGVRVGDDEFERRDDQPRHRRDWRDDGRGRHDDRRNDRPREERARDVELKQSSPQIERRIQFLEDQVKYEQNQKAALERQKQDYE